MGVIRTRNLALVDLSGATYLGNDIYQFPTAFGITATFNIKSYELEVNGTASATAVINIFHKIGDILLKFGNGVYTLRTYKISGTSSSSSPQIEFGTFMQSDFISRNNNHNESISSSLTYYNSANYGRLRIESGSILTNYKFKIQLEKGSVQTNYVLPEYKTGKTYVKLQEKRNLNFVNTVGKPEISDGVFRIYNSGGITVDYEPSTGIFEANGTSSTALFVSILPENTLDELVIASCRLIYISGNYTGGSGNTTVRTNSSGFEDLPITQDRVRENYETSSGGNLRHVVFRTNQHTLNNLRFKVQVEYGSVATEYQIPYSEYTKHLYLAQIKKKYLKVDSEKLVEYRPNFSMRTD